MPNPPVPTALRQLAGNPGKRPYNDREPILEVGAEMPAELSEAAQKVWPAVAANLESAGVLTRLDATALGMYCETYARWLTANADLTRQGMLIEVDVSDGEKERIVYRLNPNWHIVNETFKQLRDLMREFGMTPVSRTRVHTVPQKPKRSLFAVLDGNG